MIESFPPKRFDNEARQRSHERKIANYASAIEVAANDEVVAAANYWDDACNGSKYPAVRRVYGQDFLAVCRDELAKRGL